MMKLEILQRQDSIHHPFPISIFVLCVVSMFSSCQVQPTPTSTTPSLPILSVIAYWDWAHEAAREWHADAQIYEIDVEVNLPNSSIGGTLIEFGFNSQEDRYKDLIYSCTPEGCKTFEIDRGKTAPSFPCPFTLDDFEVDSKQALAIALESDLESYITDDMADISLELGRTGTCEDRVFWAASGMIVSPFQSTDVWIDAMTGEVIESPY